MRMPSIIYAESFRDNEVQAGLPDGQWVYARPEPFIPSWPFSLFRRAKIAWRVFTGKEDALRWTGQ